MFQPYQAFLGRPVSSQDAYLTVSEAAQLLGVTPAKKSEALLGKSVTAMAYKQLLNRRLTHLVLILGDSAS